VHVADGTHTEIAEFHQPFWCQGSSWRVCINDPMRPVHFPAFLAHRSQRFARETDCLTYNYKHAKSKSVPFKGSCRQMKPKLSH
jgi:hypothetical protein